MRSALILGAGLMSLAACKPWDDLPSSSWTNLDEALWDPAVVAAADGVYIRLPRAGALVRVDPGGGQERIDLGAWSPTRLLPTPGGEAVLAFTEVPVCDIDDPDMETVTDCLEEYGDDYLSYRYGLSIVRDGTEQAHFDLSVPFNAVSFTESGDKAVVYLDYEAGADLDYQGVLNLTEVMFIDLSTDTSASVPVGFSADRVLFSADESRAVVLSRSQVVVVELDSGEYQTLVTYPLTLDVDASVSPLSAALTPDGRYALITIEGSGDLYILDLEAESINLVSLPAAPSDMLVDTRADRTVLVYGSRTQVDVLEHQYFETETLELEEPATDLLDADGVALLYNTSSSDLHDLYRLDLETDELVEMRMENPVTRLALAPDGGTAVAFMRPEKTAGSGLEGYYDENYGVAIIDLWTEDVISLAAASQPLDLAFTGETQTALVLLDGEEDLLQLDLGSGGYTTVPLDEPPLSIGPYGSEQFFITHDTPLGMVTFLNPNSGELSAVAGFAAEGLLDTDIPLLIEE